MGNFVFIKLVQLLPWLLPIVGCHCLTVAPPPRALSATLLLAVNYVQFETFIHINLVLQAEVTVLMPGLVLDSILGVFGQ